MPTWSSPVDNSRSPVDNDPGERARNPLGNRLMRHFGAQPVGRNFFLLTDGTITQTEPTDFSTVAHVLWGAHLEPITDAEATLLRAAGYGANISYSLDEVMADSFETPSTLFTQNVGAPSGSYAAGVLSSDEIANRVFDPLTNKVRVVAVASWT